MLPQSPLQMPVARLDIPVLIGTPDANRLGDHSVMLAQRHKLRIKIPVRTAPDAVRCRAGIINAQLPGSLAELVQTALKTLAQRQQRLGPATRGPFPV